MAIGPFLLAAIGGQGGAVIPGAPGTLSLSNGSNSGSEINLSWSAPSDDGGAAVSGYKIQISTNGSSWSDSVANTGSTATTATVSSLTVVTQYWFRVAAINAVGTGAFGNEPNHTTTYHVVSYSTTGSPDVPPTYTESGNTYQAVRFTQTGTFVVSANPGSVTCDILVVGGAGGASGAANDAGGGGGAGGYRVFTGQSMSVGTSNITIGAGGSGYVGQVHPTGDGSNGGDTTIASGVFPSSQTSAGGGGGGYTGRDGLNGGSGGGSGGSMPSTSTGGSGNTPSTSPAQGEPGGGSVYNGGYYAYSQGGGGIGGRTGTWTEAGAGQGGAGNWDPSHRAGISYYDGTTSFVDDTAPNHNPYVGKRYFAGGGGSVKRDAWGNRSAGMGSGWKRGGTGFSYNSPSGWNNFSGGKGRFGTGNGRANTSGSAAAGTANSGSGGGGGGGGSNQGGGNGGSGCVIVRWRVG